MVIISILLILVNLFKWNFFMKFFYGLKKNLIICYFFKVYYKENDIKKS